MAFPQHVAKAACTLLPVVARHFISLGTTRYSSSLLYPSGTQQPGKTCLIYLAYLACLIYLIYLSASAAGRRP